jgi:hypothetical protein
MSGDAEFIIEKCFDDFAEDIEAVTIHYAYSPLGEWPDWEQERISRFMRVQAGGVDAPGRRVGTLRLPKQIVTGAGTSTDHYLLHHYFEFWQSGYRHYSPHFTEEIVTGGNEA